MLKKIYNNKLISAFIISQPLVDVLTYFAIGNFNWSVTFGMIIRFFFLLYSFVYLIFVDTKNKKSNYIYLGLLFLAFTINILLNYFTKNSYNFFAEIKNIFKICYFPILLLFFLRYSKNNENKKLSINLLFINVIEIAVILLVSRFTGTQVCTYGESMSCINGNSGWFYSANELSMILLMLFPVTLYKISNSGFSFLSVTAVVLGIYSLLDIGTKSTYFGLVGILLLYFVLQTLAFLIKRNKEKLQYVGLGVLMLIMVYIMTPAAPVCYNNYKIFSGFNIYCQVPIDSKKQNYNEIIKNTENAYFDQDKNDTTALILNGRDSYLKAYEEVLKEGNASQKMFGLGYKNIEYNDTKIEKIVERDFHDLFLQYGAFGFMVILYPLIYFVYFISLKIIKKPALILNDKKIVIFGVLVTLMGAYVSGHVLFSPAVTTYLVFILGCFYGDLLETKENKK